jgi:integrase
LGSGPGFLGSGDLSGKAEQSKRGALHRSHPAGPPHHRVYDLRHTYASLLLAEGAPVTCVAAQLGHSSAATTMRYYARWIPSKGKRWVDVLDRKTAAGKKLEPKSGTNAWEA